MAIYHLEVNVFRRSHRQSVVAAAAYRAGAKLYDRHLNKDFDYIRIHSRVIYSGILAPPNAPEWIRDREELWNQVEAVEKRVDAQLARSIIASLPAELSEEQWIKLVKEYVQEQFVNLGMVADIAIHRPPSTKNQRNFYCFILLTLRDVTSEGFASTKKREWNQIKYVYQWREAWAAHVNRALKQAGFDITVDHRRSPELANKTDDSFTVLQCSNPFGRETANLSENSLEDVVSLHEPK